MNFHVGDVIKIRSMYEDQCWLLEILEIHQQSKTEIDATFHYVKTPIQFTCEGKLATFKIFDSDVPTVIYCGH